MRGRILVVDDEADMVELLSFNLRKHGYEVVAGRSGLEAIQLARRHQPDLVLLDINLQDIDGYTVCETLRDQPSTAGIPVMLVTALAGEVARLNGYNSGAVDFLRKPLCIQELLRRTEAALRAATGRLQAMMAH